MDSLRRVELAALCSLGLFLLAGAAPNPREGHTAGPPCEELLRESPADPFASACALYMQGFAAEARSETADTIRQNPSWPIPVELAGAAAPTQQATCDSILESPQADRDPFATACRLYKQRFYVQAREALAEALAAHPERQVPAGMGWLGWIAAVHWFIAGGVERWLFVTAFILLTLFVLGILIVRLPAIRQRRTGRDLEVREFTGVTTDAVDGRVLATALRQAIQDLGESVFDLDSVSGPAYLPEQLDAAVGGTREERVFVRASAAIRRWLSPDSYAIIGTLLPEGARGIGVIVSHARGRRVLASAVIDEALLGLPTSRPDDTTDLAYERYGRLVDAAAVWAAFERWDRFGWSPGLRREIRTTDWLSYAQFRVALRIARWQPVDAEQLFVRAWQADRSNHFALFNAAQASRRQGDYDRAVERYKVLQVLVGVDEGMDSSPPAARGLEGGYGVPDNATRGERKVVPNHAAAKGLPYANAIGYPKGRLRPKGKRPGSEEQRGKRATSKLRDDLWYQSLYGRAVTRYNQTVEAYEPDMDRSDSEEISGWLEELQFTVYELIEYIEEGLTIIRGRQQELMVNDRAIRQIRRQPWHVIAEDRRIAELAKVSDDFREFRESKTIEERLDEGIIYHRLPETVRKPVAWVFKGNWLGEQWQHRLRKRREGLGFGKYVGRERIKSLICEAMERAAADAFIDEQVDSLVEDYARRGRLREVYRGNLERDLRLKRFLREAKPSVLILLAGVLAESRTLRWSWDTSVDPQTELEELDKALVNTQEEHWSTVYRRIQRKEVSEGDLLAALRKEVLLSAKSRYNLACYYSRLAEVASSKKREHLADKWARTALGHLDVGLEGGNVSTEWADIDPTLRHVQKYGEFRTVLKRHSSRG